MGGEQETGAGAGFVVPASVPRNPKVVLDPGAIEPFFQECGSAAAEAVAGLAVAAAAAPTSRPATVAAMPIRLIRCLPLMTMHMGALPESVRPMTYLCQALETSS